MKMYDTHKCDVRIVNGGLCEGEAFQKEIQLIKYYRENTSYRLTNIADGGNQPPIRCIPLSKETKEKISKSNKIAYNNPTLKKEVSERMKKFYDSDHGKRIAIKRSRKVMSDKKVRDKISKSNKKYFENEENRKRKSEQLKKCCNTKNANKANEKKIVQLDKSFNYIKTFNSLMEADKELDVTFKSISKVLRGTNKTAKGFVFMYYEDYVKKIS